MKKLLSILLVLPLLFLVGCVDQPCEDEKALLEMNINCKKIEEKTTFTYNDSKSRYPAFYSSTYKTCIYVDEWSSNLSEILPKFEVKELITHRVLKSIKENISFEELFQTIK